MIFGWNRTFLTSFFGTLSSIWALVRLFCEHEILKFLLILFDLMALDNFRKHTWNQHILLGMYLRWAKSKQIEGTFDHHTSTNLFTQPSGHQKTMVAVARVVLFSIVKFHVCQKNLNINNFWLKVPRRFLRSLVLAVSDLFRGWDSVFMISFSLVLALVFVVS